MFEIVNDAMIALYGGATESWGVAVVAGTSCNAWGRDALGRTGRMAGFGNLGENAGSSELVHEAIKAVTAAWTLRAPATALSQAFVEYAKVGSVAELLEVLTIHDHRRVGPAAAPLVFRVAAQGDPVAQALVEWAGRELGGLALGIIRQLDFATWISRWCWAAASSRAARWSPKSWPRPSTPKPPAQRSCAWAFRRWWAACCWACRRRGWIRARSERR